MSITLERSTTNISIEEQTPRTPLRTQALGSWFIDINEAPEAIEATRIYQEKNRPVYDQPAEDPKRWILFKKDEDIDA